jgi:hypothetical protein
LHRPIEQAYPTLQLRSTGSIWERFSTPKCVHAENDDSWIACISPDTFIKHGRLTKLSEAARPEVALCRSCLVALLSAELPRFEGRVVALEPHMEHMQQYMYTALSDMADGGFEPEIISVITRRLEDIRGKCESCDQHAKWLWLPSQDVIDQEDSEGIRNAKGILLCSRHGSLKLCSALEGIPKANMEYVNLPYGEAGFYIWLW